jgi:hypothetical protein
MIAYTGLIYRKVSHEKQKDGIQLKEYSFFKVLRLSSHSMNTISSGEIMNLLANDANKIELLLYFFNNLWVKIRRTKKETTDRD